MTLLIQQSMNVSAKYIEFEDFDNQYYQLISDENNQGVAAGIPWKTAMYRQSLRSQDLDLSLSVSVN